MGTVLLQFKKIIRKYFSSFTFFYEYLHKRVFIAFILSITVSFLDGLGLTMFFPLLQVVGEGGIVDSHAMGQLGIIIKGFENVGFLFTLPNVLALMVTFFVLKGFAAYSSFVYITVLQQSFIRKIRINQLNLLNKIDFKRFISSDVGRIQNTMSAEVERVSIAFKTYFSTFEQGIMVAVYMSFAFIANTQFAILVTIGAALTNILYKYIYKYTNVTSKKLSSFNNIFQGQLIQYISQFKYLKATGNENKYSNRLEDTIFKIEEARKKIGILASISTAAREPLLVIIITIIIFIQIRFWGGAMGAIIISLLFFYRALGSLMNIQQSWNTFMEVSGSLENVKAFQQEMKEAREKDGTIEVASFNKNIVFENVSFSFGKVQIINDVSLAIAKNKSYAFVGESGSGKTTIVNLIAGLLPADSGTIKIDDISMSQINKKSLKQRIGYVSQEPVIFNDTLFNNITLWAKETEENITRFYRSLNQASLSLFFNDLPKGMHTELGHNGINLSGGQKQRVSIARELFKDIDILILDEATSALDSETEKGIQQNIDALQGKYTLIIIAHRLSTVKKVDQIFFMDKGKIIDIGNFTHLFNNQSRFRKMVELQEV